MNKIPNFKGGILMILSRNFVKDYIDLDENIDIKTIGEDMTKVR